ncbi:helix-turn-helix transcriptional regulator [Streptomyces sp. NPDC052077]|uniref:helix-turn-helix transcriptional regulator n=1 Tax=Streptomyces sp. NPDC052077 TaxID=3154757 RepID=UPI003417F5F0
MTTTEEGGRRRLGRLIAQLRTARGWPKVKAAEAAGLTHTTYMRVEKGLSVHDVTYTKVEHAFGLAPGACMAVVEGSAVALQEAGVEVEGVRIASVADAAEGARRAVQNAVIATMPGTPAGTMAELSDGVVAELRRLGIIPGPD